MTEMATGSDSPAVGRPGVDFQVQLQVSWTYVTLDSDSAYELKTVPDVLGLHARKPGLAVVKVLLGRDSRSVRALVPDVKVLDRGFHDVILLNMGDITGPDVSIADLSLLRLQWPLPVVSGMDRLQPELERLCHACKSVIVELVFILWKEDKAGHGQACRQLSSGSRSALVPHLVVCRVWSLLPGILHLLRRLSRPRAPFVVSVFLLGRIGWEMVYIALALYRWGIPS